MYATLADLKAAITAETLRSGDATFAARVPEFIKLAEKRLFQSLEPLRVREMETRATLTVTAGVSATPANFLEARRLTWNASRPYALTYRAPEDFYNWQKAYGVPTIFTIDGTVIDVAAQSDGTATLSYYAKPAPLVLDTDTNGVLTAHGDCYLFAALVEAYLYLRNTGKADESASRLMAAVNGANLAAQKARYAGTHLSPRIPGAL